MGKFDNFLKFENHLKLKPSGSANTGRIYLSSGILEKEGQVQ
jgi:hypothetical protein